MLKVGKALAIPKPIIGSSDDRRKTPEALIGLLRQLLAARVDSVSDPRRRLRLTPSLLVTLSD